MATVGEYLQTWKLKLSTTKAVLAVFHLNNKEAKGELEVNHNNKTLPSCSGPTNRGGMLDRTATHRRHIKSLRKMRCTPEAACWGAGVTTLRTAALALVHSTTEYCAPVPGLPDTF